MVDQGRGLDDSPRSGGLQVIWGLSIIGFGLICALVASWKGRHRNMQAAAVCLAAVVASTTGQITAHTLTPVWWFIIVEVLAGMFLARRAERFWEAAIVGLFFLQVVNDALFLAMRQPHHRPYMDIGNGLAYLQFLTIYFGIWRDRHVLGPLEGNPGAVERTVTARDRGIRGVRGGNGK